MIPLGPITLQTSDKSVKALSKLEMKSMLGREELGRPFEYELELVSSDTSLDLGELLAKPMTVRLEITPFNYRYWNGIVTDVGFAGSHGRSALYRVTLRPKLSLLDRTSNCRIFQNQTVPAIVKTVFGEYGFGVKESLSAQYAAREYVVQYQESDFDFVNRLLEDEGIYYFFRHDDEQHELVLADSHSAHSTHPGYVFVPYYPPDIHRATEIESIDRWELRQRLVSAGYVTKDFDFERPLARPESILLNAGDHALKDSEIFDYAGAYLHAKQAEEDYKGKNNESQRDVYTRVRSEEAHASFEQIVAESNARGLAVGNLFTLTEFPRSEQNREYLIVSSEFQLHAHSLESSQTVVEEPFRCQIRVLDGKRPFRPGRITGKPTIRGPQTAIVVGPEKDEVWTDQYGRVKILFHWDRFGDGFENSSCWVRVAQVWAGNKWGAIHIPRIGQEVLVSFLEGDPDRPIIIGRVYNRDNMPPYDLPANQTQSGIKSRSSKGGAPSSFNEIRFEDLKGKEELFIQAERNHTTNVKNNRSATVAVDDSIAVGGDRSLHVKGNLAVTVDGGGKSPNHSSHSVTGKYNLHASDTIEMDAPTHIKLTCGASSILIEPNQITLVSGGKAMAVLDANFLAQSSDGSKVVLDTNAYATSKGGAQMLLDANVLVKSKGESQLVLDGDAKVTSSKGDVKLQGLNVEASGEQKVTANGGGTAQLELSKTGATLAGQKVGIQGAATTEILGAIVKIN
jgi:type VI secretion system secreted protein VgrG